MAAAPPPDSHEDSLEALPDLVRGIELGYVSFSQLAKADWGCDTEGRTGAAYRELYPDLLRVFQASHGLIEDRYSVGEIRSDVARTSGAPSIISSKDRKAIKMPDSGKQADFHGDITRAGGAATTIASEDRTAIKIPARARQADFHFVYDLAMAPIGGELLTRVEMLASDATRVLGGRKLIECLDQLYSKTTDALGIIRAFVTSGSSRQTGDTADAPKVSGMVSAQPHATLSPQDRLAIINRDLDVIELKYLITDARLQYFGGSVAGALAIGVLVAIGAALGQYIEAFRDLGRAFGLVVIFGSVGALLSVVQRMSSGSLDVRYDLGQNYVRLLGGFRPVIGAFGGVLVWLLAQAKILSNPTSTDFFFAALAFALGIAERSLGDVVTESGILARLTPGQLASGSARPRDQ